MSQLFPKSANLLVRAVIVCLVFSVGGAVFVYDHFYKSSYINEAMVAREQPVPFSHKHHVKGLGIDCRYCHTSVETSSFAGIPPVKTCMTCHSQLWTNAQMLEPVREAYRTGKPLEWVRVNSVPDYVYFNHSIHISKGIACVTCHGPVGEMPLSWRQSDMSMKWCLSCHRDPEKFVRPRDAVFKTDWKAEAHTQKELDEFHKGLAKEYKVKKLTDCTACHR